MVRERPGPARRIPRHDAGTSRGALVALDGDDAALITSIAAFDAEIDAHLDEARVQRDRTIALSAGFSRVGRDALRGALEARAERSARRCGVNVLPDAS